MNDRTVIDVSEYAGRAPQFSAAMENIGAVITAMGAIVTRAPLTEDASDSYWRAWCYAETADGVPFYVAVNLRTCGPNKAGRMEIAPQWPETRTAGSRDIFAPDRLCGDSFREIRAAYNGSVTVSADKAPETIARDFQRRFMSGYAPLWRACNTAMVETIARSNGAETMAHRFAKECGLAPSAVRPNGPKTAVYDAAYRKNGSRTISIDRFGSDEKTVSFEYARNIPADIAADFIRAILAREASQG